MALTYTALGLVVAAAGLHSRRRYSTHTCSLASLSSLPSGDVNVWLVYPATPLFAANALTLMSNRQQGGSPGGVFVMGRLPDWSVHHAPPHRLARFCLYRPKREHVAGRRHALSLCVGMGLPLMLITVFGNRLLPKRARGWNKSKPRLVLWSSHCRFPAGASDWWYMGITLVVGAWVAFFGWAFITSLQAKRGWMRWCK